jgi:hypothetical protein
MCQEVDFSIFKDFPFGKESKRRSVPMALSDINMPPPGS